MEDLTIWNDFTCGIDHDDGDDNDDDDDDYDAYNPYADGSASAC